MNRTRPSCHETIQYTVNTEYTVYSKHGVYSIHVHRVYSLQYAQSIQWTYTQSIQWTYAQIDIYTEHTVYTRGFNGSVNIPESCDLQSKFDPLNIICKPFLFYTYLWAYTF